MFRPAELAGGDGNLIFLRFEHRLIQQDLHTTPTRPKTIATKMFLSVLALHPRLENRDEHSLSKEQWMINKLTENISAAGMVGMGAGVRSSCDISR